MRPRSELQSAAVKMRLQLLMLITAIVYAAGKPLSKAAPRNKLLLISFDGFRWDYDQDVDTPNLDQLSVDGVKAKYITPPMLTMTSPSHFTTITGNHDNSNFILTLATKLQLLIQSRDCTHVNTGKEAGSTTRSIWCKVFCIYKYDVLDLYIRIRI